MNTKNAKVMNSDIHKFILERWILGNTIACDIETTGLDPNKNDICTLQLYSGITEPIIIKFKDNDTIPINLKKLMEHTLTKKIFHHATFDLSFMYAKWGIESKNVACTKVLAKLLYINNNYDPKHYSLKNLIKEHFNIVIDKKERLSNWKAEHLNKEQIEYAINDVIYLIPLYMSLYRQVYQKSLPISIESVFEFIPTYVKLKARNLERIYEY